MCGICGELRFDGAQPDLGCIARMAEVLRRRGPDHGGSYSDGPLALGHRRLSVIDLSERSHQPLVDTELGLVLVFNGTIYNYPELRAELARRGYHFFTDGDSEVILKAYAAWGERCVERLHGMFAFAVWEVHERRLLLARDRLGIKPLYYSANGQRLRFASNIQALLAGGSLDTTFDPVALHHHFTLHAVVPAPRTVLNGVRKVAPATTLACDEGGTVTERRYWMLNATRPQIPLGEGEWVEAVHGALGEAVRRRKTIADVPVGVLLSGGLDSSLLVALLAEAGVNDLLTFSVGFEDMPEERGSEFEFSDQVAARYGTRHHKFRVPNEEVLKRLPEAVRGMAEPMVGQDAVAFYLLAEQVSRHVKVVQSGQGADEVFAGYFWYPRMEAEQGSDLERFRLHYFDRDHEEYLETVDAAYHGADHTSKLVASLLESPGADTFLDRVLRMDVATLVVDDPVKRVDNMTMAWGLEARVPFLDHELVELAASMPAELKLKDGGKYPLKAIARGRLPEAVIDRPKGYFPVPALKYVRGEFLEFMRGVLDSQACRRRGLYRREYVDKLLAEPEGHFTRIQGSKLWHLALLEYWLQLNVDVPRGA
ncbi:MAG: N-acetylglutaminylglutamine amidotransferase [Gammaproteobacteria bacterium]|nr:N-acetylglutaminylglutamine amidotransferase [Gammaproteobacteria bacterium]NIR98030.1 N-acetylglutaminylglutamine amidotransferase [Gammaproteobacteria bacterium]NIT63737.1 N-acetylglutaminylglutamine amidotransferase [Gammaproteobacteria bacterium]NIV19912.1 N-acetylglutaminylglutamine amidotransferase [Gammaproteobacteria bacterium]NIX11401.1 N-acetylglutaminylglutamine amidotransferase [Gammaproteobacteria bacterium]